MNRDSLNTLASVFGWGFVVCVAMQLFTLVMYLTLGGVMTDPESLYRRMFPAIGEQELQLFAYGFLALWKALGLTFLLAPWVALKIVARRVGDA